MKTLILVLVVPAALLLSACDKKPEASFTISPEICSTGDTVLFTNTSLYATSFEWEFGDGTHSSEKDPRHVYTSGAYYTVKLTAINDDGSDAAQGFVNVENAEGALLEVTVHSEGLEGNLLEESPYRKIYVYLPPGYDRDTSTHYPVLYLLHGWLGDKDLWFGGRLFILDIYDGLDVSKLMDSKIADGSVSPMIIVAPDGRNAYDGCWYTNSSVAGNWEDYIVEDIVSYTDAHFRTIPKAERRGIAGHSMGGYGAMAIALKHPDIFKAVYSLSGADLSFEKLLEVRKEEFIAVSSRSDSYDQTPDSLRSIISRAVAYAPKPDASPIPAELPHDSDGKLISSVWNRWLQHDPIGLLPSYLENPAGLSTIKMDCGDKDQGISANTHFSNKLTELGIDHVYEIYEGNHTNGVAERMNSHVLKFFSENLIFE